MVEEIVNDLKTLSKDIQYLKRQSQHIGTTKDDINYRRKLTSQVSNISSLVIKIKTTLQKEKQNGYENIIHRKLEKQFLDNFQKLTQITAMIRDEFRKIEMNSKTEEKSKSPSIDSNKDTINLLNVRVSSYGSIDNNSMEKSCNSLCISAISDEYERCKQNFYEVAADLNLLFESNLNLNPIDVQYEQNDLLPESVAKIVSENNVYKTAHYSRQCMIKLCVLLCVLTVFIIIILIMMVINGRV
eukprot:521976_1